MRQVISDFAEGLRGLSPARFPYRRFALALLLGGLGGSLFVR